MYYDFDKPVIEKEVEIKRALSIFRIHTVLGYNSVSLSRAVQKFFKSFHSKVFIKKNTMVLTAHPEAQFALLDYIELHRGDKVGYTCANNSVTQITDPTLRPESEIHSNIALTAGMECLNLLGSTSGFKLFPVYDAPTEQMLDEIRTNLDSFTSRCDLGMETTVPLRLAISFLVQLQWQTL